ncbi:MAG: alpha/beta hydrolase [Niabella sp.]
MKHFFILMLLTITLSSSAQKEIPLYDVIPNSKPSENVEKSTVDDKGVIRLSKVSIPTLTIFTPEKPNGTAIIICPGGGYQILAASHEGSDVAKELNNWGITAIVLKYRLPDNSTMLDKAIGPLQDAERAIQQVRLHAKQWGINPKKIGIMGFSAGGHLAASLSTRYKEKLISNPKKISFKPNFSVLVYPVISFTDSLTHMGSRNNLIGKNPSEWKIKKYANELNVTPKTPPAFLVHAKDDKAVPYKNSLVYKQALEKYKIPATLKTFENGGHGFGMNNKTTDEKWMDDLKIWLQQQKFL